jgi:replication-associated recombination protein RarA
MENSSLMLEQVRKKLFTKKYEPKEFKFFVLPDRVKEFFPNGKITRDLLLYGSSGTGKSSLIKKIIGENGIYINASVDNGIDMLRKGSRLYEYCAGFSFDTTQKYVFFDEIDNASEAFFKGLKGFMDSFGDIIFIATTNHINNIPIHNISRMELVNYDFISDSERKEHFLKYVSRAEKILQKEEVGYSKEVLVKVLEKHHPDFRKMLQIIQKAKEANLPINKETEVKHTYELHDLYDVVTNKKISEEENIKIHQLATSSTNPSFVIQSFDESFFDYLREKHKDLTLKYADAVILVTQHNNMLSNRVSDKLVLKSLLYSLKSMFAKN